MPLGLCGTSSLEFGGWEWGLDEAWADYDWIWINSDVTRWLILFFLSFWQLFGRSMYLINDMIYLRKRSSPSSFSCAIWSRVCPNVLAKLIPTLCIVLPKFVDTHRTSFWCSHFHFISRVDANNASSGFATSCRVFQRFLKAVAMAQFTVWNGFGVFRASRHKSNFPFHRAVFNNEDWWKHPKDREELHDVGFSESFSRFDSSTKLSGSGQSVKVDQRGCPSAFSNLLHSANDFHIRHCIAKTTFAHLVKKKKIYLSQERWISPSPKWPKPLAAVVTPKSEISDFWSVSILEFYAAPTLSNFQRLFFGKRFSLW